MTRASKRLLFSLLSALVAMAVAWLWWRAFQVSSADVRMLVRNLDWRFVPMVLGLVIVHVALSAWRWSIIEAGLGGGRPRFDHAFASGAFAIGLGTVLPGPLANVACRSLTNSLNGESGARGAVSGTLDQVADFVVAALLAIPAGAALLGNDPRLYLAGAPAMILAGLIITLVLPRVGRSLQGSWPILTGTASKLVVSRAALVRIYGISVLRLINLTLITLGVHYACQAATVVSLVISVPLVAVAVAIVMLPGSIGSAEWSFSSTLARQSVEPQAIVSFVLANRLLLTAIPMMLAIGVLLVLLTNGGKTATVRRLDGD